jgi:hypothetical protein
MPIIKDILKLILLIISFIVGVNFANSQDTVKHVYIRHVLWTTPVKRNTIINGVAIGVEANTWKGADYLKINGLNIEIAPFSIIAAMYALGGTISSLSSNNHRDSAIEGGGDLVSKNIFTEKDESISTKIKGVSISFGGLLRQANISGISINGLVSFVNKIKGIELTGLVNLHYEFNGIMIAGLRNKVTKGKGLQIGLINTCKSGQVLQIGIINRIGKRITPIINFAFKKS